MIQTAILPSVLHASRIQTGRANGDIAIVALAAPIDGRTATKRARCSRGSTSEFLAISILNIADGGTGTQGNVVVSSIGLLSGGGSDRYRLRLI